MSSRHHIAARARRAVGIVLAGAALTLAASPPSVASATTGVPTWHKLHPTTSPPARDAHAMAYDAVAKQVVLFGGYNGATYLSDTWTFDGATWSPAAVRGPSARASSTMTYDAATDESVLFGGYDGSIWLGDTWTWHGGRWHQEHPAHNPPPATGAMLFADPQGLGVDLFGGFDGQFYHGQTWRWTGSDWLLLTPRHDAWARSTAVIGTDVAHNTTVMFGGLADVNPVNTWTYDGTTWRLRSVTDQPSWRFYAASAYDATLRRVVTFGGDPGGGKLDDTWEWNGSTWVQLHPWYSPPARSLHAMVWDDALQGILLFGGIGTAGFDRADTWLMTV